MSLRELAGMLPERAKLLRERIRCGSNLAVTSPGRHRRVILIPSARGPLVAPAGF